MITWPVAFSQTSPRPTDAVRPSSPRPPATGSVHGAELDNWRRARARPVAAVATALDAHDVSRLQLRWHVGKLTARAGSSPRIRANIR